MGMTVGDKSGNPVILSHSTADAAYSYVFTLTAAQTATPTTLFQLQGAAGTVVRIKYVQAAIRAGTAASSAGTVFTMNRKSATATGGTGANNTIAKHDTNSGAAAATATHYTAAPAAGAGVAVLRRFTATLAGTAADATDQLFTYQSSDKGDMPITLRGTTDFFSLDLAVALSAGQNLDCMVQWEEGTV